MAFFHNRTVNLLNIHSGISMVALSGGGAFFAVYMLQAGLGVPQILLGYAAIFAARFVIRPLVPFIAARTGLRRLFIIGAVGLALQFPLVAEVHGLNVAFFWMIAVAGTVDTVYWPVFHAYFAQGGDAEHRGQQLGLREAISACVGILSPLIAGWLLVAFGPRTAFAVTAVIQVTSAVPLFFIPEIKVAAHVPGAWRASLRGAVLFATDGWISAGYVVAWQFALFFALQHNYLAYGGALAVAALVGAVSGILLGRFIDAGNGGHAVLIALSVAAVVAILRAASGRYPVLAVAANAVGALCTCLYLPTLLTAVYNLAKRAPCTLRFQVAAEGGWDFGMTLGCLLGAALVWQGLPLSLAILSSLLGMAMQLVVLRRYYRENPNEAVDASLAQLEEVKI